MRLLIDAGNTRVKWQVVQGSQLLRCGSGAMASATLFRELTEFAPLLSRVAISTVISEVARLELVALVEALTPAPVSFYWAEAERNGLKNAYEVPATMGADRWHALYAAWINWHGGVAVVDAGSALTLDFLSTDGRHRGGYILPGRAMMQRGLRQDAARIGFEDLAETSAAPGRSTTECVHNGLNWLWLGLVERLHMDCRQENVSTILLTGGGGLTLQSLGLDAELRPDLVFEGLAAIDDETFR